MHVTDEHVLEGIQHIRRAQPKLEPKSKVHGRNGSLGARLTRRDAHMDKEQPETSAGFIALFQCRTYRPVLAAFQPFGELWCLNN